MDNRSAKVLCVGSSRTEQGIDRELLEKELGVPVAKYAVGGADVYDQFMMIRHYFSEHPSTIRVVVCDLDIFSFNPKGFGTHVSQLFYPFMDNHEVDRYLRERAANREEYLARKYFSLLRFNTHTLNLALRGYLKSRTIPRTDRMNIETVRKNVRNGSFMGGEIPEFSIDPAKVKCLQETVNYIESHGARAVLLYMPSIDIFREFDRNHHESIRVLLGSYAKGGHGVIVDGNGKLEHHYELFYDPVHLNEYGKAELTKFLSGELRQLL